MLTMLLSLATFQFPFVLFEFSTTSDFKKWRIMNDGVMGGVSESTFTQNKVGNAVFKGAVSLDYNGGFASVRYGFETLDISGAKTVKIRLKGDQKNYQCRVRNQQNESHIYKYEFETSGAWEIIEIPLQEMTPSFRGTRPNIPNYAAQELSEIGFLIANKKKETFDLEIDKIWLE